MNMELPKFPVNLALFNIKAHNPSFYELNASLADAHARAHRHESAGASRADRYCQLSRCNPL